MDKKTPILIVDDYRTMLRIVRNLLKQLGFDDVDEAVDGPTALAKLKARRFGLIISDWNMQPMTGLDLLRAVRADPALDDLPFIMVTAEQRMESALAAQDAGADSYIVKPFNAATLQTKIQSVLGG